MALSGVCTRGETPGSHSRDAADEIRPPPSFLTGIAQGQVSEFSLILLATGLNLGHITTARRPC